MRWTSVDRLKQLSNLGPDSGQRVPAPKDVRGTTVLQPGTGGFPAAKETTVLAGSNGSTAQIGSGASATAPINKP